MTGWIIFGSIVGLLALLLVCPVSLRVAYREEQLKITGHYLFLRTTIVPSPEPTEEPEEKVEEPKEKKEPEEKKPLKKQLQSLRKMLDMLWGLAKSSTQALALLKRHLVFYKIHAFVLVGGPDAHTIGTEYAKHCTLVPGIVGLLSQFFHLKEPVLWVNPDFLAEETQYDIQFRVRMRPLFVIQSALLLLFQYIKQHTEKNKTKGGKKYESTQSRK